MDRPVTVENDRESRLGQAGATQGEGFAAHAAIREQHGTQRAPTGAQQPALTTPQAGHRQYRAREHHGPGAAAEGDLAHAHPAGTGDIERGGFVGTRRPPVLAQGPDPKPPGAVRLQMIGERVGSQQPMADIARQPPTAQAIRRLPARLPGHVCGSPGDCHSGLTVAFTGAEPAVDQAIHGVGIGVQKSFRRLAHPRQHLGVAYRVGDAERKRTGLAGAEDFTRAA